MTRKVTPKDGADAVAMLDTEKPARKRAPRLHVDPTTGATVLTPKATTPKQAMQAHEVKPKAPKESKAALVRSLLDQGKTVKEIAAALKDQGVTWSYAWDVAAAYEKKTGKIFIASHGKDGAK
jgi:hypothetical protein